MITPKEAAEIAEEHPNGELLEYAKKVEEDIRAAALKGRHETPLHAPYWLEDELARLFQGNGWDVCRERKCYGGVWQEPMYYIHW